MYHGDIALGATLDIKFTTVNTSGVPTTLAGTPVISAYIGNGTTELTAGITLSVDFDGVTGLHNVRVVASSGNGYAVGTDVQLVITTGTVGGASVVGYVIGSFSIAHRPVQSLADAVITAAKFAANAINSTVVADGFITSAKFAANALDAVWSTATRTLTSFGTLASDVWAVATRVLTAGTNIVLAKGTGITGFNDLSAAQVESEVVDGLTSYGASKFDPLTDGVLVATGGIDAAAFAAGAIDAAALNTDAAQLIADEFLNRDLVGGSSGNTRNVRNALRALRNKVDGSTGTLTVYEENDSTPAWTAALTRNGSADPITVVDPA